VASGPRQDTPGPPSSAASPDDGASLDPRRWKVLREELEELVELDPAAREERLGALEPSLARELRALLVAAPADASAAIEDAVAARAAEVLAGLGETTRPSPTDEDRTSLAGTDVGPWRVERLLGRGGMAEVWEARRVDGQFEQTVALKLLKRGMDSEEILRRFLRERQILAQLDHPGIARLFDGGLAPDGRPYFVLERIEGQPITEWCKSRHLGVEERLRLVVDCCETVASAHRRLVVHRDLKPSNILVNAAGQVKLLDFGIAKLLSDDAEGDATRAELRVLTPAYAAPEQVLGEPVSTATDVYAMGVLAYELLTGRLPHRRSARHAEELAAEVRSESIARPSTAVLTAERPSGGAPPPTVRHLSSQLRGDLDAILLTALRREPARRYPSIDAFADDLRRYLSGRPVSARPDSFGYRTRKFVARHRLAVTAASLALATLVAAVVVSLAEARRAELAAASERAAAAEARTEATKAEAMTSFLTEVFTAADPEGRRAADLTAAQLVQQGAAQIDKRLADQPATRASMLHVLGNVETRLGLFATAQPLLERALALRRAARPPAPVDVANSAAALGVLYHKQGRSADGVKLLEEALALHEAAGAAGRREVPKDLNNLANAYKAVGRSAEARAAFERAIALLEADRDTDQGQLARVLNNYGLFLTRAGEPDKARDALERALALHERTSGPDSALVSGTLGNLSELYIRLHDVDRAVGATERALAISEKTYGPNHYETGIAVNGYGWALLSADRPAEARAAFERSIAILRASLGDSHRTIGYSYRNLGQALAETGHRTEAIVALRTAADNWSSKRADDPDLASIDILLAPLLIQGGDAQGGERLLLQTVALEEKPGATTVGRAWVALARLRLDHCRVADARQALDAAKAQALAHPGEVFTAEIPALERDLAAAASLCPESSAKGAPAAASAPRHPASP
jgi:eukaryotic-like serine/threonine-protein kinase